MKVSEKITLYGENTLSSTELLTAILGKSAAQRLFDKYESFLSMSAASMRELLAIKGMDPVRAAVIKALFEIARRMPLEELTKGTPVRCPEDICRPFQASMRGLRTEMFYAVFLDGRNNIICSREVAKGTATQAVPHVSEILSLALEQQAASIACLHNHPSGNTTPSREDKRFTEALKTACEAMDMKFVDHLIIGEDKFFSFAEAGVI